MCTVEYDTCMWCALCSHVFQQWRTFARQWWLYDASHQCPFLSAHRIIPYLMGRHKPIYHALSQSAFTFLDVLAWNVRNDHRGHKHFLELAYTGFAQSLMLKVIESLGKMG